MISSATTLWGIIEEHVDEAAFLLEVRRSSLRSPDYTVEEVRMGPDARLLAHVDALVVGGDVVRERVLIPNLEDEGAEPDVITASALALLAGSHFRGDLDLCIRTLCASEGDRATALAAALELADRPEMGPRLLTALSTAKAPTSKAALLRVVGFYRVDPGHDLHGLLADPDPLIVGAALGVASRVPRTDCLRRCESLIQSDDPALRNAALVAATTLGSTVAWSECVKRASRPADADGECLLLMGLLGRKYEHQLLSRLIDEGVRLPAALWASGFAGRREHVDAAVQLLTHADPIIAKLAGEVFTSITGYVPNDTGIVVPPEAPDEDVPFEEDDLDADLAPDPSDALAQLEPQAAQLWWNDNRPRFTTDTRFVSGRVLSNLALSHALSEQSTRRRSAWALGLAVASGGTRVLDTTAFYPRQVKQLTLLEGTDPNEYRRLLV